MQLQAKLKAEGASVCGWNVQWSGRQRRLNDHLVAGAATLGAIVSKTLAVTQATLDWRCNFKAKLEIEVHLSRGGTFWSAASLTAGLNDHLVY